MTMHATIYGRAAFAPRQHQTKNGNDMTSCRVAVDLTGRDASDEQTLWVDVLSFGNQAEVLARIGKGDTLSAMGRLTKGTYTAKDGTERESWTLLADAVLTAKSGRPGGNRKRTKRPQATAFDSNSPAFAGESRQ